MDKIEIKMLESIKGRDDDEIQTKSFRKGETYFVGAELHHVFVKQLKVAKAVTASKAQTVPENKTVQVPENKTVGTGECQDNVTVPAVKKTVRKKATKRAKK